jgi:hypothetical protein
MVLRKGLKMFYGNKDECRNALHIMQRKVCEYDGFRKGNPPSFCDCKYGYNENSRSGDEQSGCPELRTIIDLLDAMTEEEYCSILNRNIL